MQVGYLNDRLKKLEEILSIEKHVKLLKQNLSSIKGLNLPQLSNESLVEELFLDLQAVKSFQEYTASKKK